MDFRNISNQDLLQRLEKLARTERKITHHILWHIHEVESRKLYFDLGFESLYSYLIKELKYSESAAYRRIQAARLLTVAPTEVTEKLESGALNLSQLAQVQKCLKDSKKCGNPIETLKVSELLQALENKNTFDSEQILAKEFDFVPKTVELTKPQKDDSVRVEITLSKEQFTALKLAKSLLSHQCPGGQWSEVITLLAEKFCQSRLGKNTTSKPFASNELGPTAKDSKFAQGDTATEKITSSHTKKKLQKYRTTLPVKIRRTVLAKAQYQCEHRGSTTGARCTSKFQLEIDHRKPLALGGSDDLKNLRILCRRHNQLAWQQSLGAI